MSKVTKAELDSWYKDKTVQDNIVESWVCIDCGVNTNPGCPDGPQIRIDNALNGGSKLRHGRDSEVYHVKPVIWEKAGMQPWSGCLCIACLEKRIGRQLRPKDFDPRHDKVWADMPCTERLLNRRGFATVTVQTKDGPREVICDLKDARRLNGAFIEEGTAS
jgi:hypothetical protein